ncbi:MAG: hypothetical protein WCT33_01890 [Patescibacteria group bacterium]|jgi:hypothetical protein
MTLIITHNGKRAEKVDPTSFPQEDSLQEYIFNNPESVPIYDIRDDIKLLILAREFSTDSGPIDAVGIDNTGDIYLIETKLYKNPDKRKVVAQVLDYGASLWHNTRDANTFLEQLNTYLVKQNLPELPTRMQEFFGLTDEGRDQLLQQVRRSFQDGSFKFVVLMDSLHEQLKNLIIYINQNSEFDIFAVELKYYKHGSYEIVIPRLFGSEVKKDLTSKTKPGLPSDQDFISAYTEVKQEKPAQEYLDIFHDINEGRFVLPGVSAHKTPKTATITVEHDHGKTTFSLWIDPAYEGGGIDTWTYGNDAWKKSQQLIAEIIPNPNRPSDLANRLYARLGKWQMNTFTKEKLTKLINQL